jgi:predicted SnoaL-like aldol condensation-catalyzing enzyme|tara:strand:- start:3053 stop:3706 length:654 start_codon:yes stop_codon:yes gene_type:complete
MISTKFVGRLGNQMFQKAAVIGYGIKHNVGWTFKDTNFPIYKEPCFEYVEIPFKNNLCLSGYFQSDKYFNHCKEEIIEYFTEGWNREPIDKISIHVRRGDYVNIECHPVVTMEYLNEAIQVFKNKGYTDNDFLVFTDDKAWCSVNLPYPISSGDELEDLELMSRCEHHIISNSSYSWWGATLGVNKDRVVVAPSKWFAGSKEDVDVSDIYCDGWIVI